VYYLRSLTVFSQTLEPAAIDTQWLHRAIEEYQLALESKDQSPLADIPAKAHFGLGVCYTMLCYAGEEQYLDPAIAEFEYVIQEYDNGANHRIKERAAESYARLGLIYNLSGYFEDAVIAYEKAISLSDYDLEKQAMYRDRIEKINQSK